MNKKIKKP